MDYGQFTTFDEIELSGFGNIGIEFDQGNSIVLTSPPCVKLRTRPSWQRVSPAKTTWPLAAVKNVLFQWIENEIIGHSATGGHFIPRWNDAPINRRYADGKGTRNSPGARAYTCAQNRDGLAKMSTSSRQAAGDLRETNQAPQRNYSRLRGDIKQYGFDLEFPFLLGDVALDAQVDERIRNPENDRFYRGNFFLGQADVTYIDSTATLPASGDTAEDVPLTGGRRLQPFFENERGKLDFLARYLFQVWGSDMEVALKVTNILNEGVKWTQGGNLFEECDQGIRYELSCKISLY